MAIFEKAEQKPKLALATLFGLIVLLVVFLLLVVLSASGPGRAHEVAQRGTLPCPTLPCGQLRMTGT